MRAKLRESPAWFQLSVMVVRPSASAYVAAIALPPCTKHIATSPSIAQVIREIGLRLENGMATIDPRRMEGPDDPS